MTITITTHVTLTCPSGEVRTFESIADAEAFLDHLELRC